MTFIRHSTHFQIKVRVPITLMDIRSDSGLEVFPVDTEHKFAVSISSYPEQVNMTTS